MRLWVLLLLLPMTGCLDGPVDDVVATVPVAIAEPGFHALEQAGGTLSLTARQDAVVALYGPDDVRLGQATLRPGQPAAHFRALAPGAVVLHVVELNGTLLVEAPGATAPRPLLGHMERVVLVDRPPREGLADLARIDPEPVQERVALDLERPPQALVLRSGGGHEGLHVLARGDGGLVLESRPRPALAGSAFTGHALEPVPADVFPANVRDGRLDVEVRADHLDGVLLLEAWSYSRATPAPAPTAGPTDLVFDHGPTNGRPVHVGLHERATVLALANDGDQNATVAVFGPRDQRIGVYTVPPQDTVRVPVQGGDHVVAPLVGDVRLLVDRVPRDFELHPLETRQATYPRQAVGEAGRYEQRTAPVEMEGVVFQALPASNAGGWLFTCHQGATTRLSAGGETIGVWSAGHATDPKDVAMRLGDDLSVVMDGIGGDCNGPAVRLVAYVR